MDRLARFSTQSSDYSLLSTAARFEALQRERARKRSELESSADKHVPTCWDMCPEYERLERELHLDVHPFEARPGIVNANGSLVIDHSKAVKKYHRPAAGNETPLPEDIRTPAALSNTLSYLLTTILNESKASFSEIHSFIRDRTRAIRQDLTLQRCSDSHAIALHEHIARFHILSGELLAEADPSEFDAFQNTEQLRKVLQSLHEMYSDLSTVSPNEDEFRGYYVLTHLQDPNIFKTILDFPPRIMTSDAVQFATRAAAAFHQGNYVRYRNMMVGGDYLQSALLFSHISSVRERALEIMGRAYQPSEVLPTEHLARSLAFEDLKEARAFLQSHGLAISSDGRLRLQRIERPSDPIRPARLSSIGGKQGRRLLSEIVTSRPAKRHVSCSAVAAYKESLRRDIYYALVEFCVPILIAQIAYNAFNEHIRSLNKLVLKYKQFATGQLYDQFIDEAISSVLSYLISDLSSEYRLLQKRRLAEQTYLAIEADFFAEALSVICRDVWAIGCADDRRRRRLLDDWRRAFSQKMRKKTDELHRNLRLCNESSAASAILGQGVNGLRRQRRLIDLKRLLSPDFHSRPIVVWMSFDAADANVKMVCDDINVVVIDDLKERCPHIVLCLSHQKRSMVEKGLGDLRVPWQVYCFSVDEFLSLPDCCICNLIPELVIMDRRTVYERLDAVVNGCQCSNEYQRKLNSFIQKSIDFLFHHDPAKLHHPHSYTPDSIYYHSLENVESRLRSMITGLETPIESEQRESVSRPSSGSPLLQPAMKRLQRSLEDARQSSATFEKSLVGAWANANFDPHASPSSSSPPLCCNHHRF